jgi:hypothetical protein
MGIGGPQWQDKTMVGGQLKTERKGLARRRSEGRERQQRVAGLGQVSVSVLLSSCHLEFILVM